MEASVDCTDARRLMYVWLDGEAPPDDAAAIRAQVSDCAVCARRRDEAVALSELLRSLPYYPAPAALRQTIRARLDSPTRSPARRPLAMILAAGAAAAAMLAVVMLGPMRQPAPAADAQLRDAIAAAHVRSLMLPDHLADVPSSDQHTVKPWFDGKLDFAPPVVDLAASGYPLIGGRLEYVAGHPAAGLVYKRRQHVINLFVWPDASRVPLSRAAVRGFNLYHWTAGGMTFWAASDVNEQELAAFARLISPGV